MYMIAEVSQYVAVASFAEAWIEISIFLFSSGMDGVASFAEAWIEIFLLATMSAGKMVASFAEAWIEIYLIYGCSHGSWSPPSRRRGLK